MHAHAAVEKASILAQQDDPVAVRAGAYGQALVVAIDPYTAQAEASITNRMSAIRSAPPERVVAISDP